MKAHPVLTLNSVLFSFKLAAESAKSALETMRQTHNTPKTPRTPKTPGLNRTFTPKTNTPAKTPVTKVRRSLEVDVNLTNGCLKKGHAFDQQWNKSLCLIDKILF